MTRGSRLWPAAAFLLAAGCGGNGNATEPAANDAQRQAERMENMAEQMRQEAENRTSAIERALENETQAVFESRNELLNEAADNGVEPADNRQTPANASR